MHSPDKQAVVLSVQEGELGEGERGEGGVEGESVRQHSVR
jgi:hypothetical protein